MSIRLPEWFSIVRNNLCHRTGITSLRNIFASDAILPNDGRYPDTYPQSRVSLARNHKLVSLFDFKDLTMAECHEQTHNWYRFFFDHQPVTIVLILDRQQLASELIANHQAAKLANGIAELIYLPKVEAFYPGPIPCAAIRGYLIICSPYEKFFESIPEEGKFDGIFKRIDDFVAKYAQVYKDPLNQLEVDLEK